MIIKLLFITFIAIVTVFFTYYTWSSTTTPAIKNDTENDTNNKNNDTNDTNDNTNNNRNNTTQIFEFKSSSEYGTTTTDGLTPFLSTINMDVKMIKTRTYPTLFTLGFPIDYTISQPINAYRLSVPGDGDKLSISRTTFNPPTGGDDGEAKEADVKDYTIEVPADINLFDNEWHNITTIIDGINKTISISVDHTEPVIVNDTTASANPIDLTNPVYISGFPSGYPIRGMIKNVYFGTIFKNLIIILL